MYEEPWNVRRKVECRKTRSYMKKRRSCKKIRRNCKRKQIMYMVTLREKILFVFQKFLTSSRFIWLQKEVNLRQDRKSIEHICFFYLILLFSLSKIRNALFFLSPVTLLSLFSETPKTSVV